MSIIKAGAKPGVGDLTTGENFVINIFRLLLPMTPASKLKECRVINEPEITGTSRRDCLVTQTIINRDQARSCWVRPVRVGIATDSAAVGSMQI